MSRIFVDGGLVFPAGLYGVGDHVSDDIVFAHNQKVPFAINLVIDQDVVLHFDVYVGDVLRTNMIQQAVTVAQSPATVQVSYVLPRWKLRIECAAPTNLVCEVVAKKES
jgi:hypothetical protein